jgi:hypothetical protein
VYDNARANQIIIAYHITAKGNIAMDVRELSAYKRVPLSRLKPWPFATGLAVKDFLLRRASLLSSTSLPPLSSPSNRKLPPSSSTIVSKL